MELRLTYKRGAFRWRGDYHSKHIPKEAGFRWSPDLREWWTDDPAKAQRLNQYADERAREQFADREETLEASRAEDANIEIPTPAGLTVRGYQKAGVDFFVGKDGVLLADEMGTGKTIQILSLINYDQTINNVLIICPASLKVNWAREAEKWLIRDFQIGIVRGKVWADGCNFIIINYELLKKHREALRAVNWDLLVVDESHALKNPKAQRTKEVLGGWNAKKRMVEPEAIKARKRIFLTGTPILNRPIELWPLLKSLDPNHWKNWKYFVTRYCAGYEGCWGWDVSGASNTAELGEKLRSTIMIRRLKKDVLADLPPKVRQVIELPSNGATKMVAEEKDFYNLNKATIEKMRKAVEEAERLNDQDALAEAVEGLKKAQSVLFEEMSELRHEVALKKLPMVIEHVRNVVESGSKVVVFGHHRDVLEGIKEEFGEEAVLFYGGMSESAKQNALDAFQKDDKIRVFAGSIKAAGVGITLTASSHVIFAELDWTPAWIDQAEDRCHRIGATGESILIQHLVFEGSLDAQMARMIIEKQGVITEILDKKEEKTKEEASPEPKKTGREETITKEEKEAVHTALQNLAGMCDGAYAKDGMGFNKFDAKFGKQLAFAPFLSDAQAIAGRKIALKYRRQIHPGIYQAMWKKKEK